MVKKIVKIRVVNTCIRVKKKVKIVTRVSNATQGSLSKYVILLASLTS
jgi:hypothetical protein